MRRSDHVRAHRPAAVRRSPAVRQDLPGAVMQRVAARGEPTGLTYSGQVSTVSDSGAVTVTADAPWLAFAQDNDVTGRVRREWTPAGAAFTDAAVGAAEAFDREYRYDPAGRLRTVRDRTATTTGGTLGPGAAASGSAPCRVREYGFDPDGNRTALTTRDATPDGSCAATGGATTSWSYDTADRLVTAGTTGGAGGGSYGYDPLGRVVRVPAGDAPDPARGEIGLGYFDIDAARTVTQGGQTTSFAVDVAGRRETAGSGPAGGAVTRSLTRHYTDGGDNPAWVEESATTGAAITRYAETLGGDLGLQLTRPTLAGGGAGPETAQLTLTTLRGDLVATADVPPSGPCTSIGGWADYGEYGAPRDPGRRRRGRRAGRLRVARRPPARHPHRHRRAHPHGRPALQPGHRPVHQPRPGVRREHHRLHLPPKPP